MKIYTLLKSRKCALPKERPANKDFIKYIHDENNKFVQSIESLTGDDKLTQKIRFLFFIKDDIFYDCLTM